MADSKGDSQEEHKMTRLRKLLLGKLTLLTAFYLGHMYSGEVDKLKVNVLEGRTEVREGYYRNIGDLRIYREKINGKFVPSYGVEDYKIRIGEDMLPKNMYEILERKVGKDECDDLAGILHGAVDKYSDRIGGKEKLNLLDKLDETRAMLKGDVSFSEALKLYMRSDSTGRKVLEKYIDGNDPF